MKGLILSGGKGTRLRPLTFTRAKQLIPIANKSNLLYVVDDLVAAGVSDLGIVISPETGDEIRQHLLEARPEGVQFTFIEQGEPLGLAHAVQTAQGFLGNDSFVMYLGDNLLSGGIGHLVQEYENSHPDAIVLLTRVENPRQFGVAVLDPDGRVLRLVEKPKDPPSDLALVGVYLFSPRIHEVIRTLKPSWRGEYEITEAIQGLVDRERPVVAHLVRGWWKDTGKPEDLLEANRLVLSQITRNIEGEVAGCEMLGEIVLEAGARVTRSELRGPIHIASGAVVEDSYVGPYTSIGQGSQVIGSEVEFSILLPQCEVLHVPYRLDASVIGQGALVTRDTRRRRQHTVDLVVGDFSRICL
ncbi:MAG: glucose-1-phosphate thymidylyltransferase [Candidatus Xenobium sp.]|nr:glucose-1-phosphate thymidylyltransferase [Burkholderiales bacterium]